MKKNVPNDLVRSENGDLDDRCDLDPSKTCDNCFRCLEMDGRDYAEIPIGRILLGEDDPEQYGMVGARRPVRLFTLRNCRARRGLRRAGSAGNLIL